MEGEGVHTVDIFITAPECCSFITGFVLASLTLQCNHFFLSLSASFSLCQFLSRLLSQHPLSSSLDLG